MMTKSHSSGKPKFTELTDGEQVEIENRYLRREKPIGERWHLKAMLKHLKKLEKEKKAREAK